MVESIQLNIGRYVIVLLKVGIWEFIFGSK